MRSGCEVNELTRKLFSYLVVQFLVHRSQVLRLCWRFAANSHQKKRSAFGGPIDGNLLNRKAKQRIVLLVNSSTC